MDLAAFLSEYKNHPVLFIGTGISKRYYSESYTWDELLSKIVLDYCDDEEHYLDLKSKSMSGGRICNYAHLAQLIENEFNEIAQKERNGKFKAMNDIFYDKMKTGEKI
ncbi:MAG: SIR2 family protein, partial [Bacteroidales bacterium]|nr:SIR2 family protein [Bacteroidales bacterium]